WNADESYSSTSANDNTSPAENGTIVGTVAKVTSGAAVGDDSKHLYTSSWSGSKITLKANGTGDKLIVKSITGDPSGVQVYRVDEQPYYTDGLNSTTAYYYGVFSAQGTEVTSYKVVYKYADDNGVVTADNEIYTELMSRSDGSITTWTVINDNPDTAKNK